MKVVRISKPAERDFQRLYDFLIAKSERAAFEATHAIRTTLGSLDELSERGFEKRPGGWRQIAIPFGRDGYVARYRLTAREVVVLRIFHGRERR